ncbi:MAG: thioredoxin domain-containing protein, partial [Pseudomonadota bacterium]|nr:thioredoxin domain-containing protein [Pseudomonadota bacterium]
ANTVERTQRGHRIGKPDAEAQLTEFISYTCSACANYERQGGSTLDLVAVDPGKVSIEVRPFIRNALDLTIAMLAQCGDVAGFKNRHRMFLYSQGEWLPKARQAPQSQQIAWSRGDAAGRLNAARALDLDDMLVQRGLTMPQINACLANDQMAQTIMVNSNADRAEFAIDATPSFALDGSKLDEVYSWPGVAMALQARFAPPKDAFDSN